MHSGRGGGGSLPRCLHSDQHHSTRGRQGSKARTFLANPVKQLATRDELHAQEEVVSAVGRREISPQCRYQRKLPALRSLPNGPDSKRINRNGALAHEVRMRYSLFTEEVIVLNEVGVIPQHFHGFYLYGKGLKIFFGQGILLDAFDGCKRTRSLAREHHMVNWQPIYGLSIGRRCGLPVLTADGSVCLFHCLVHDGILPLAHLLFELVCLSERFLLLLGRLLNCRRLQRQANTHKNAMFSTSDKAMTSSFACTHSCRCSFGSCATHCVLSEAENDRTKKIFQKIEPAHTKRAASTCTFGLR